MTTGDAAPAIVLEPWDANPDCMDCEAREAALAGLPEEYLDPADQATAASAVGYCALGKRFDRSLCGRVCPIGKNRFQAVAAAAVAASRQPKVRADRLSEEE